MKTSHLLENIQSSLSLITGFQNPHSASEFLVPTKTENSLLVREQNGEAEIMICLCKEVLERLENQRLPEDFQIEKLPDFSVVIEELSHFNTLCQRMMTEHPVSQLELEVQAEVDKFGVSLEWLEARNEAHLQEKIFEVLFDNFKLGDWVPKERFECYEDAHHIARNFCRKILNQKLSPSERRKELRNFFQKPSPEKLSPKF